MGYFIYMSFPMKITDFLKNIIKKFGKNSPNFIKKILLLAQDLSIY